jgi:hypothetical protein
MSSDEDAAGLMAAFKKKPTGRRKSSAPPPRPAFSPAAMFSQDGSEEEGDTIRVETPPPRRRAVAVRVQPKKIDKREYKYYEAKDEVEEVLREFSNRRGEMIYEVRVFPEQTKQVSEQSVPGERRLEKVKVIGHGYAYVSTYKGATLSVYLSYSSTTAFLLVYRTKYIRRSPSRNC